MRLCYWLAKARSHCDIAVLNIFQSGSSLLCPKNRSYQTIGIVDGDKSLMKLIELACEK